MSLRRRIRSRGSTLIEFTLVGIPLIFLLISTFEIARGMWHYHTLAHAIKTGARYAIVHGQDCATSPNHCTVTIGQIASVIRKAGIGLPPDTVTLTLLTASGGSTRCTISDCMANYTTGYWPPDGDNAPGRNLRITGTYPFQSIITMLWPGAGTAGAAGTFTLSATARESIQF